MTTTTILADLTDLVESVHGVVTVSQKAVTPETKPKPHVHVLLPNGQEFTAYRPTVRHLRDAVRDWLEGRDL